MSAPETAAAASAATQPTVAAAPVAVVAAPSGPAVRMVLQRAKSCSLLVDDISRRVVCPTSTVVCHIAFFAGATPAHVAAAARILCETKIFAFEKAGDNDQNEATKKKKNKNDEDDDAAPAAASASAAPAPSSRAKPAALSSDLSLSVCIVPQASICGKVKSKAIQYHSQSPKDEGKALYNQFVETMRKLLLPASYVDRLDANGDEIPLETGVCKEEAARKALGLKSEAETGIKSHLHVPTVRRSVKNGTYGNTQSLMMDSTCGPMTHVLDVDL